MRSAVGWLVLGLLFIGASVVGMGIAQDIKASRQSQQSTTDAVMENLVQPENTVVTPIPGSVFVPILMYHYIRDYRNENDILGEQLSVAPATLDRQLAIIKAEGYETISLSDFAAKKYQGKPIILTFDDGYKDHFTNALPILDKYDFSATFFVATGLLGKDGYMTEAEVTQLKAAGMEIGGHTINHKNLANTQYEKAIEEIASSLRGRDKVFSYPSGKYSFETLDIVSGLGIKAAVTTNIGIATEMSNIYELPRIRVKEKTDLLKRIGEETAIAKKQIPAYKRTKE